MDIRVINKKNEIVNLSNMDKIMVSGKWIVGINDKGECMQIEEFESEEEAKERLEGLGRAIEYASESELEGMVLRT